MRSGSVLPSLGLPMFNRRSGRGVSFAMGVLVALSMSVFAAWSQPVTVVAWGSNQYGECNVPADLTNAVSISASSGYNIALRSTGTLQDWGGNGYPVPPGVSGVSAVSYHFLLGLF